MERESSDEEEDKESLIDPNNHIPQNNFQFSPLHISKPPNRFSRHFPSLKSLTLHKKSLIAISLSLLSITIFFSLDLSSIFLSIPVPRVDRRPSDRALESQLHALYLLRNQHLGLLNLLNRSHFNPHSPIPTSNSNSTVQKTPPSSNSTSNSSPAGEKDDGFSRFYESFRSGLVKQIKINQEVQKALLSAHQFGNFSAFADDGDGNLLGSGLGSFGLDVCGRVDYRGRNRTVEWKPKPNRYLLAICVSGQMSNHLICLEKHMFFAAILNRVLVLPSPRFDYQYDRVIDVEHINKCFGRKVVISFDEFVEIKQHHLHVDRFICYVAKPPCYLDEEHIKRLKSLGLSMGKIEAAWPGDGRPDESKKRVLGDVLPKFSSNDEVLAIGDMFFARVEEEWVQQPGGPLMHKCRTVIQPSRIIVNTAQRFIQTFMGGNFIALHFRRHGFLKFCNVKKESCFFPIPQAAECILRVVEKADAPLIYLSTDAAESEIDLLQTMTVVNGKSIPLVKRPSHTSAEKWDALLYRNHISGDNQVEAMLDKTICAMSSVFIGSSGSTFTEDILRLRKEWGSASNCDEYLCQGEKPNFIADPE